MRAHDDLSAEWNEQPERAALTALPELLSNWLGSRRWFADKGRVISAVEIEDALVDRVDADWLVLCVVNVGFADGANARYFLPLVLTQWAEDAIAIGSLLLADEQYTVIDATERAAFGSWLLDQFAGSGDARRDRWKFCSPLGAAEIITDARLVEATLMGAEQSNTSLRFGGALIVKLVRRLQPGPNPDEESLRVLEEVRFSRVPRFAGAAFWRSRQGDDYPVALAQGFVPNEGDGWSWMLRRLERVASGEVDPERDDFLPERLLGCRTGELHVALSRATDPAFHPERPDVRAIEGDVRRTQRAIEHTVALLHEQSSVLPNAIRANLPRVGAGLRATAERAEGYRAEAMGHRIRVHGDYHLGQTLRTPDEDWTIIDFEGEPARPVAARRQKTSALKDVAGMLRSFAYARGVGERVAGDEAARRLLADWEIGARHAFLEGYCGAIADASVPLAPADDNAFGRALAAWELDKALYEIGYEARNRPDWIALPLRTLLPELNA